MRTLLPLVAVCVLPFVSEPASAQIIAVPGEAVPAEPVKPPAPPLGQRMAPALKVRHALPPRLPDGRRHPDERRLLHENQNITDDNIRLLDAWLEELAEGEWTEADRAAVETALDDLIKEYRALAEIHPAREGMRLPRLRMARLQKPLMVEPVGGDPEVRKENLRTARYNLVVTKANVIEAEIMPDCSEDAEAARKYHSAAAKVLSDLEERARQGRSGAGEGVRKARAALKTAAPGAPDPD